MKDPFPKIPVRRCRRVDDPTKPRTPRSSAYRAWCRTQRCAFCGAAPPSEFSHHGQHGIAIKASDLEGLPACAECHRTGKRSHTSNGELPGAPKGRDERRAWLLRLARAHVNRWRRSRG